jgi:hypothetical protein
MVITGRARRLAQALGPDAGAAVMASGIVSVAMRSVGRETLSSALLVLTAIAWAVLGALFLHRACLDPGRWRREAERASSLTAVAGTAVLGVRLTLLGWSWAGWTLLAIATTVCLMLLRVLRNARVLPSSGAAFLLVVAPQSLAVLAARLADRLSSRWLALAALFPFAFGLGAYVLVIARFDFAELRTGAGDHWVSGGALAISTLACGELSHATATLPALGGVHDPLRIASVVLWVLTVAWLPALVGAEALWTRGRYEVRRWATVFPLGMYAVMSFTVGAVTGAAWMVSLARAWAWVALAAWIAVTVGTARSVRIRGRRPDPSCAPPSCARAPASRPRADASRPTAPRQNGQSARRGR